MLTVKRVAALKEPGRYHDGHGLCVVIKSAANKSWQLRYQRNGRERWLGLGPLHVVTLAEARERARRARLLLLDGVDPIDERRRTRAQAAVAAARSVTFREAAQQFFAKHAGKWTNQKHTKQFLGTLEAHAFPV